MRPFKIFNLQYCFRLVCKCVSAIVPTCHPRDIYIIVDQVFWVLCWVFVLCVEWTDFLSMRLCHILLDWGMKLYRCVLGWGLISKMSMVHLKLGMNIGAFWCNSIIRWPLVCFFHPEYTYLSTFCFPPKHRFQTAFFTFKCSFLIACSYLSTLFSLQGEGFGISNQWACIQSICNVECWLVDNDKQEGGWAEQISSHKTMKHKKAIKNGRALVNRLDSVHYF